MVRWRLIVEVNIHKAFSCLLLTCVISGLDPARQAFDDAVKAFRSEVSEEDCSKWLSSSITISDVEKAVIFAKEKYEKKSPKSRARKWLTNCSSRLMYYSGIMDTLAQHHPEYVSLAWGAIKFLFIVSNSSNIKYRF
jgi:hypothetical protein